tara:strand:- start:4904 stop:5833 length:930 start_codon:yes stop_codon:yes gene_type:complete
MYEVIPIALPIFLMIAIGYVSSLAGIFGKSAASEINNYVVYIGLPSLLFVLIIDAEVVLSEYYDFMLLFISSTLIVFVGFLLYRRWLGDSTVKSTLEAFGASYSNTGFMGIPLCLLMFGDDGAILAIIATVITACFFLLTTLLIVEVFKASENKGGSLLFSVLKVFKNPIVLAPVLALLFSYMNFTLSEPLHYVLKMLGDASIVFALLSIGLFLHANSRNGTVTSLDMVITKSIIHPVITAVIGTYIFELSTTFVLIAVLLSMLPIGTGPYMVAILYGENLLRISRGILVSTIFSLFSITLLIWVYLKF